MNLFTWLIEDEFKHYSQVEDAELNELFQEIRNKFPDRYYIYSRTVAVKTAWFRKRTTRVVYTVFVRTSPKYSEVGHLNIPNTKEGIMTYFFGMLTVWNIWHKELQEQEGKE